MELTWPLSEPVPIREKQNKKRLATKLTKYSDIQLGYAILDVYMYADMIRLYTCRPCQNWNFSTDVSLLSQFDWTSSPIRANQRSFENEVTKPSPSRHSEANQLLAVYIGTIKPPPPPETIYDIVHIIHVYDTQKFIRYQCHSI